MNWGVGGDAVRPFEDGLGVRRLEADPTDGRMVEVLEVSPGLAAHDGFEDAIHARVARMAEAAVEGVSRVHRVERRGSTLRVVAEHVEGLRLPDFFQETIKTHLPLPQHAALELAGRILRIVAALHHRPGLSHGAITASHIVTTRTGSVLLTDAVFGPALESLQRNREQLWREFRLAFPASASLPRFDQRADVAQLGATVLGVTLGRPLRASEYPRSINEAVIAATLAARAGESGTSASALRMWLQESLHLHPRATFASAIDAELAFAKASGLAASRRGGAAAFEDSVRLIFGDTAAAAATAELARAWSRPAASHHAAEHRRPVEASFEHTTMPAPQHVEKPRALGSILRSVFPGLAAS